MGDELKTKEKKEEKQPTGTKTIDMEELKAKAANVLEQLGEKVENIEIKAQDSTKQVKSDPKEALPQPPDPMEVAKAHQMAEFGKGPAFVHPDILKPSRPYSFVRAIKAVKNNRWHEAVVEWQMSEWLKGIGMGDDAEGLLVPIDSKNLPVTPDNQKQIHDVMTKGCAHNPSKLRFKALSTDVETAGGYLVAPEQAAEIIELIRAQAVVSAAGAQEIPLPRSGILPIPRQTGGGTAYWVGENLQITDSQQTLGQLLLIAKKCAALVKLSNEMISDATPAAESFVREDVARVIALAEDLAFLQGVGTAVTPRGIVNHEGITLVALGTNGAVPDADTLSDLMTEVESNNGQVTAFITHPRLKGVMRKLKDSAGNYIFDPGTTSSIPSIHRVPLFWSGQLPTNLVKGSSSNCTRILAGQMSEALIGRKAVLELDASTQGDTPFQYYQTWIRAISRVDFGLRTENVFSHTADAKIA